VVIRGMPRTSGSLECAIPTDCNPWVWRETSPTIASTRAEDHHHHHHPPPPPRGGTQCATAQAMHSRRARPLACLTALCLCLPLVPGCDDYPRDPEGTLGRVTGGTLRVGVSEGRPWVWRQDGEAR